MILEVFGRSERESRWGESTDEPSVGVVGDRQHVKRQHEHHGWWPISGHKKKVIHYLFDLALLSRPPCETAFSKLKSWLPVVRCICKDFLGEYPEDTRLSQDVRLPLPVERPWSFRSNGRGMAIGRRGEAVGRYHEGAKPFRIPTRELQRRSEMLFTN